MEDTIISDVRRRSKGTGRKKIDIKKIENNSSLKVAFSKRRQGLFRKAEEICLLCDATIAVIVFSPKGRVYEFGHPSAESVIDRFLGDSSPPEAVTDLCHDNSSSAEAVTDLCLDDSSPPEAVTDRFPEENGDQSPTSTATITNAGVSEPTVLTAEKNPVEGDNQASEEITSSERTNIKEFWWEEKIDELSKENLEVYVASLAELIANVKLRVEDLTVRRTREWSFF